MSADISVKVKFSKSVSTNIVIGGVKLDCSIEADVIATVETWYAHNMGGRMEDAVQGEQEVTLDSVEMEVCLENKVTFTSTDRDFFEAHFGEIDCDDVVGLP